VYTGIAVILESRRLQFFSPANLSRAAWSCGCVLRSFSPYGRVVSGSFLGGASLRTAALCPVNL
jgi:hypothetical protein